MRKLKPGWKRVMLGDVVLNSTVATRDYEADGFAKYIIGKHIPEDGGKILRHPLISGRTQRERSRAAGRWHRMLA